MVDHQPKSVSSCVQIISEAPDAIIKSDLNVDDELIELIKMLARGAARDDHRKAKSVEPISIPEAGRE